jgi:hypothetical protein
VIEVHLDLGGYPVTLLDTAGIRDSDDPIEQEGVRRARARATEADLVLWVEDAREVFPPSPGTGGAFAAQQFVARCAVLPTFRPGSEPSGFPRTASGVASSDRSMGDDGPPMWLVVNKVDLQSKDVKNRNEHELGLSNFAFWISAASGEGLNRLFVSRFDVIVIGGGHAGCEAAAAAARMGATTALVTHRFATVGAMSCNPAIGGLGKGHLVREIDALDGLMGRVADLGGIQFRVLNRRKGLPCAVRAPRPTASSTPPPCNRRSGRTPGLTVIEGEADDLLLQDRTRLHGVRLADGREFCAGAVVLTTGTFLRGLIHIGERQIPAGRVGEAPALGLSRTLERAGFALGRLKTGTPPRLDGRTIDWAALEMQPGDEPPEPFSELTESDREPQIHCGITRTNEPPTRSSGPTCTAHQCIPARSKAAARATVPRSRTRSCVSANATGTRSFLEPEGLDDDTVYPNGISTSLPEEVQHALVRPIPGLERA